MTPIEHPDLDAPMSRAQGDVLITLLNTLAESSEAQLNEFITLAQAAKELGLTKATIVKRIMRHRIKTMSDSDREMISRAELTRLRKAIENSDTFSRGNRT